MPEEAIPLSMNLTESLSKVRPLFLTVVPTRLAQVQPPLYLISSAFQCVRMTLSDRSAHQ